MTERLPTDVLANVEAAARQGWGIDSATVRALVAEVRAARAAPEHPRTASGELRDIMWVPPSFAAMTRRTDPGIESLLGAGDELAQELRTNREAFGLDDEEDPEGALALSAWPDARTKIVEALARAREEGRKEGIEEAAKALDAKGESFGLGAAFHGGPLHGASVFNAYAFAAKQVRALSGRGDER